MTATVSPRVRELQAIPRIYRRLMCSVILKRICARSARVGRPYVNGQRREELLQDAFAHAWVWLQECTLDYWAEGMISPKEAAILAAYRGADRAFDGRALPGEDFDSGESQRQVRTLPLADNARHTLAWEEREDCEAPPFSVDDLPEGMRPLARHLMTGGTVQEWADKHGRSTAWVYTRREAIGDKLFELMGGVLP